METTKFTKADAEYLFYDLIQEWAPKYPELVVWTFAWDDCRRRLGFCDYVKKQIGLSSRLTPFRTREAVRNTLLHEIAHAVTEGHGHDRTWRAVFVSMGGDGHRCSAMELTDDQALRIHRYVAKCPVCGYAVYANRLPKRRTSCGRCAQRFSPAHEFVYVPTYR